MGWESSDVVKFDLGPVLQGERRIAKIKSAYNSLIIGPRCLQCETNLYEIMTQESFDVVRFDLGLLLHGQTRIAKFKVPITGLLLVLEVCNVKPTVVIENHGLGISRSGHIWTWVPPSRSNNGSLALVSCLSSGYKFALYLQCAKSS